MVKNIASRFHIPNKTLTRLNTPIRKRQVMYAGKKLVIPVWLRQKNSVPQLSEFNLADYELDTDSLDSYVKEDFICMADIETDTIRRIAIDKETRKINRKIMAINYLLDSIEQEGKRNLSNREIRKMPLDRARRIGNFTIGLQIDTLTAQRKKLSEEKTKIDLRVADYEYLVENASYMASHTDSENKGTIQIREWGDDPSKTSTDTGKSKKR